MIGKLTMTNEWILDVIADLRRFADLNHMPRLAVQLDQSAATAQVELNLAEARTSAGVVATHAEPCRTVSGRTSERQNA